MTKRLYSIDDEKEAAVTPLSAALEEAIAARMMLEQALRNQRALIRRLIAANNQAQGQPTFAGSSIPTGRGPEIVIAQPQ